MRLWPTRDRAAPIVPPQATLADVDRLARSFPVTRVSVLVGLGDGETTGMLFALPYDPEGLRSRLEALAPRPIAGEDVYEASVRYSRLERRYVLELRRGPVAILLRLRPRPASAPAGAG